MGECPVPFFCHALVQPNGVTPPPAVPTAWKHYVYHGPNIVYLTFSTPMRTDLAPTADQMLWLYNGNPTVANWIGWIGDHHAVWQWSGSQSGTIQVQYDPNPLSFRTAAGYDYPAFGPLTCNAGPNPLPGDFVWYWPPYEDEM